ncbi:uncharacterized protein LOC105831535 isoform X1 [Monomorium pharaonis]|uniref:uncharacterized protein LOC105831535 isoform X1 n=1 Tax=Monomorium pharaonis TaxID=307658 RepID=UPI00063F8D3D|nr:uncharacterized protein LOC105831535 isoform X1 [Monomorium pharaonis]XP_012527176.1 uncharacterized protein LOC105831535 isoform X1 [Monomorium pharaonis]XP_012527177.1 uncharacterized protein LOC105831535 isoform X1 [Monomorium pharaonis]XP_012527179.1 uncharacterized protein LOC105831535 isoform X1 [Monomorium pharaonis]XP_036149714.1 uncharacterized protein LOC105831535 isoform X1 [Monomorium pharaonis]
MLSYMLPTEDKPPPGEPSSQQQNNYRAGGKLQKSTAVTSASPRKCADATRAMIVSTRIEDPAAGGDPVPRHGSPRPVESPKHNGTTTARKSTLHNANRVTKDDSLYSIDSVASTAGSERKNKILNGAKHASLKRVSFGSSKGSMVETLVYETPVQEEPEINHFLDHNGRLPPPMIPVPDTDEGREKVRVSLLGPQPSPATPGVLLLEPITHSTGHPLNMANNPAELLTTHTEHTTPAYHTQISTDSGWDNPFRPDGDLSREADEIVELIKGGKPITPTPGQNAPPLPGCDGKSGDSSTSPLLKSNCHSPRPGQENGSAHGGTPSKTGNQPVNEKVGSSRTATVEVARMTAQGPGDASQVEHVTLKKKPKCKCCVLQ